MYRMSGKCTSRGEREERPMLSQLSLAEHSGVTRCICATVHWQIVLSLICFLAPEGIKQNVWYDIFCAFRRERIVCDREFDYLATWAATCKNGQWLIFTRYAKQPVILSSSTHKTQFSQVRSEAWVEKIKSHSVSLSFPKGSNCSVFSNFIPLFPRFLFPLGARHLFSTHWTLFCYLWSGARS